MIKEGSHASPSIRSPTSRPILVVKSSEKPTRVKSARLKVTFSECTFKKQESTPKTRNTEYEDAPKASKMTLKELERLVKSKLQGSPDIGAPTSPEQRPQSVSHSARSFLKRAKESGHPGEAIYKERQGRVKSGQFSVKAALACSSFAKGYSPAIHGLHEAFKPSKPSSSFRQTSYSFREPCSKDFKISSAAFLPGTGGHCFKSSYSLLPGRVDPPLTEPAGRLGIDPEVNKRSKLAIIRDPQLTRSLIRLHRIGFPEKNIRALVEYANRNDKKVITCVSSVVKTEASEVLGNLESLIYERKQVENMDRWEDQQRLKFRIKSAIEGSSRDCLK
jgi:hypothetical protein